ncbi:hypothetical protein N9A71_06055, partial [Porticoccaceae bacterium]|nr:hypothetical protein [Porticoccaceae bacterium]
MASAVTALKTSMRWLWLTLALLIIGTVILVVIGRQTIANVDQFREPIAEFIEEQIGLQVDLGELRGEWPRLIPIIEINHAVVQAADESPALMMQGVRADLDLFNSIVHATPIWRELVVDSLTLTMIEDERGRWGLKGFERNADTDLSIFIDPLTYSRVIRAGDVQVELQFYSGKTMFVNGRNVAMENTQTFHRAELSVILSEQQQFIQQGPVADINGAAESDIPAYLLIEGHGDLADIESFSADGYFRFDDFNLSEPLADLVRSLMPTLFANL